MRKSRIDHIHNLSFEDSIANNIGLRSAYCFCLTPRQACNLLKRYVVSRVDLRSPALKKVCADIDVAYASCHRLLLEYFLSQLLEADSRGRQGFGYCLSVILGHVPPDDRRTIQEVFLASKYITVRRRGYKSLSNEIETTQELLRDAWERFGDTECAWLIVKSFPPQFLVEHRKSLLSKLMEGWQIARLYLRIAEIKPRLLPELKAVDQISYCYVLAKLGKTLGSKEAMAIVDANSQDERIGLLVWSFGRLGLWSSLEYVESQMSNIVERQIEGIRSRYGI